MTFTQTRRRIYGFYRYDCCWPYSLAFILTLIIYWLDFFSSSQTKYWPSLTAFGLIFAYYLYNLYLAAKGRLKNNQDGFFIKLLTLKIIIWAAILGGLIIRKIDIL